MRDGRPLLSTDRLQEVFVPVLTIAVEGVEKGLLSWLGLRGQMPARMQDCVTVGEGRRISVPQKDRILWFCRGVGRLAHCRSPVCQYPGDRL